MKKSLLIFLTLIITMVSCAQKKQKKQKIEKEGHKIEFNIAGLPNAKMLVAYHYSGKHYISDTIYLNT